MPRHGVICQGCGIEAPSRHVEFYQNIGMLVMRQTSAVKGNLCKRCLHAEYWKRTGVTLGIGWLGTISMILTPIFVIQNTARYLFALGMPPVPPGAGRPFLGEQAVAQLAPHANELITRLNAGQPLVDVACDLAPRAGVTPGQVVLYVTALTQASRNKTAPPTYGFPVQPPRAAGAVPLPLPAIPVE